MKQMPQASVPSESEDIAAVTRLHLDGRLTLPQLDEMIARVVKACPDGAGANEVHRALRIDFASAFADAYKEDPKNIRAIVAFVHFVPDEFATEMDRIAVDIGLMPERPAGYSDGGERVYDAADIASRLGIEVEDIPQEFLLQGPINRAQ